MRKLVLNILSDTGLTPIKQLEIMKDVGWDGYFDSPAGTDFQDTADFAQKIGLFHQSVHAPFKNAALMWEENESGDEETARQTELIRACADRGVPLIIMHTIIGMDKHSPCAIGSERFGKVFEEARRLGVTIALENTEGEEYLERLMTDHRSNGAVRFCIDTGHEMCYNGRRDLIGKYGDRLVCTHLNDNMGQTGDAVTFLDDSHMMPFDGTADWSDIALRLNKAGYTGDLTFEIAYKSRQQRDTHKIYESLDYRGFIALVLEKARKFAALLDKKA